jgi:hypothetical protein
VVLWHETGISLKAAVSMPGLYYFVRVSMSEDWVRFGYSKLLVQLVCEDHAKSYESDRERSACQLAREAMVDRHNSTAMGYADAARYSGQLPDNFRTADCSAPCGCGVWYWSGP